jgi:hypothetical protein
MKALASSPIFINILYEKNSNAVLSGRLAMLRSGIIGVYCITLLMIITAIGDYYIG